MLVLIIFYTTKNVPIEFPYDRNTKTLEFVGKTEDLIPYDLMIFLAII